MPDAIAMHKTTLFLILIGLSACGQQAPPGQNQTTDSGRQTHAAASPNKGQIIQPPVKKGKDVDASALLISFHGCADLLLTDSRGRKLGYDPANKKNYLEIPGGVYDEGDLISDDEEDSRQPKPQENTAGKQPNCASDKTVQVPHPAAGMYMLKVGNNQGAAFKLEVSSYGADAKTNGHYVLSQQAGFGPSPFYQFELPPSPGTDFQVKAASK